jgi:beta-glucanase (GH16 family)
MTGGERLMNKIFISTTICLLSMTISIIAQENTSSSNSNSSTGYKLVWSDEFNKNGRPDPNNWTYERGFVRNEELQWYQPDNARCENGMLIIEGRRERKENPRYRPDNRDFRLSREYVEYTSSSLTTRRLQSWQYGRFEMRGRIDTRPGLWPAFWTLGIEGPWPSNGEIDIMEYYRGLLLANAAWAAERRWTAQWDDSRKPITEFNDPN